MQADTVGRAGPDAPSESQTESVPAEAGRKRQKSTIRFPYGDLEDAVKIARAMHDEYGGTSTMDQLAAALGQQVTSGAFRTKVATAKTFGVAEGSRDQLALTGLGRRIVDPQTEAQARQEAFMAVPLYERLYNKHRGGVLPSDSGLEADMVSFGVSIKQAGRARQAFQRSAQQAGFFAHGRNRLVLPGRLDGAEAKSVLTDSDDGDDEEDRPGMQADPLLASLFKKLPPPDRGDFGADERQNFVAALEAIFTIVYGPAKSEGDRAAPPAVRTDGGRAEGADGQSPPTVVARSGEGAQGRFSG